MKIVKNRIRARIGDPSFIRIQYIRYADDFIVGIASNKKITEIIKSEILKFLIDTLDIKCNPEKTHVRNIFTRKVMFLGVLLSLTPTSGKPYKGGKILTPRPLIEAPISLILAKLVGQGIGKKLPGGGFGPRRVGHLVHEPNHMVEKYFYQR